MDVSRILSRLQYGYRELSEHYDDRHWWRGRIKNRVVSPIHTRVHPGYDGSVKVMEEDWDNLLILDACRADAFEEVADLTSFDSYRRATSTGSATPEWTERNFAGQSFGDTVYVSANPHTTKLAGDSFHGLVEVWRDAYDDEFGAVYPEDVTEAAIDACRDDKRLVVHYIQPHPPFVEQPFDYQFRGWDQLVEGDGESADVGFWQALEEGLLTRDEVWDAYRTNLDHVLDEALKLDDAIDGRTVITSDHGTLFGERLWPVPMRSYSHARGLRHPDLVDVPWAVSDGTHRSVVDDGTNPVGVDDDEIRDRLADLGYAET
jgi:hypothetical protein